MCSVFSNPMSDLHPLPQPAVSSFCWSCDQNMAESTIHWKDWNVTCCWLKRTVSVKVCHRNISLWRCSLLTEMSLLFWLYPLKFDSLYFVHVHEIAILADWLLDTSLLTSTVTVSLSLTPPHCGPACDDLLAANSCDWNLTVFALSIHVSNLFQALTMPHPIHICSPEMWSSSPGWTLWMNCSLSSNDLCDWNMSLFAGCFHWNVTILLQLTSLKLESSFFWWLQLVLDSLYLVNAVLPVTPNPHPACCPCSIPDNPPLMAVTECDSLYLTSLRQPLLRPGWSPVD